MYAFLLSTTVIFVAELGDKSQLMAMTFAARYRIGHRSGSGGCLVVMVCVLLLTGTSTEASRPPPTGRSVRGADVPHAVIDLD